MLEFDQILIFSLTSLALIFTPGPDIIYVLTRGVAQGRSAALSASAGFALGNFAHTFFAVVGISAVIASSAALFNIVKFAGAAYLIYLGIKIFKSAPLGMTNDDKPMSSNRLIFRQSVLANILNPKVAVFFLAFFPQFIRPENGHGAVQMILLGTIFVVLTMIGFGSIALMCGYINRFLTKSKNASNILNKAAGSILVLLGLRLLWPENR